MIPLIRNFLAGIALAIPASVLADSGEVIRNVVYYEAADEDAVRHRLDIYLPRGAKNFPVVVFFHGGGWSIGSKDGFLALPGHRAADHGKFFTDHGIAAVFANYRLSPKVKHPEHVQDAARAVAWVRRNLPRAGGDPDQIFLMGHSAGGHLCALLASDPKYLMDVGLTPGNIRGVIPISGPFILSGSLDAHAGGDQLPAKGAGALFSHVFGNDPVEHRKASPIAHVHAGMPPFLVAYADGDLPTLPAQAVAFSDALKEYGNAVHPFLVKDASHQSILKDTLKPNDPLGQAILQFIRTGRP